MKKRTNKILFLAIGLIFAANIALFSTFLVKYNKAVKMASERIIE